MGATMRDPARAFDDATRNRGSVQESNHVGCYSCCTNNIRPNEIRKYVGDEGGGTALCPHCEIDAILPNSPTDAELKAAHDYWFGKGS